MSNVSPVSAEELCITCGLCCNGVIFGDVKVRPEDELAPLPALQPCRARAKAGGGGKSLKLPQPCAAFEGGLCRIYAERPHSCREFECLLFKAVKASEISSAEALRLIRKARRQAENVKKLLCKLGDADETAPLAKCFRRVTRRAEQAGLDKAAAAVYGELTLAVHELNLLLSESFYPGQG